MIDLPAQQFFIMYMGTQLWYDKYIVRLRNISNCVLVYRKEKMIDMNRCICYKLVQIFLVLLQVGLFGAALISLIGKPVEPKEKLPWLGISFINIIGPIIYFMVGLNMLDQKAVNSHLL